MADVVEEKTVYRLFAMPLTSENITIASNERFSRATPFPAPGYVLIYTDAEKPDGAEEITKDRVELLSPADEQWLFDSNVALIAEEIELHKDDYFMRIGERIDALEDELKRQKGAMERKGA